MRDRAHIYLLAFPRSGSHWLRYCIEFITKRMVHRHKDGWLTGVYDPPLRSQRQYLLTHFHKAEEIRSSSGGILIYQPTTPKYLSPTDIKLILLLRDFKESIPSQSQYALKNEDDYCDWKNPLLKKNAAQYMDALSFYDSFVDNEKKIVFYEDFMTNIEEVLKSYIDFFSGCGISREQMQDNLSSLLFNLNHHKAVCRNDYILSKTGKAKTKGVNFNYYQRKTTKENLKLAQETMKSLNEQLYDKYLLRYHQKDI